MNLGFSKEFITLINALVISFLLHILICSTFIFTFPLKKESHKPNLIFIGSILQNQFFASELASVKEGKEGAFLKTYNFSEQTKAPTESPFSTFKMHKPSRSISAITPVEKTSIKSTFEEAPAETPINESDLLNDLGLDNLEYKPFKFHIK